MYRQRDLTPQNILTQDLKIDILNLKKELASIKEENQLLKVKVRKLQSEVSKKDKRIETLLDPRKTMLVRKVISEEGAAMLINLQENNFKLQRTLIEKDSVIKRLQNDLQIVKLYSVKPSDKKKYVSKQSESSSKCDINLPYYEEDQDSNSEKGDGIRSVECNLRSSSFCETTENIEKLCFDTISLKSTGRLRSVSADRTQHHYAHRLANNINQIRHTNNDIRGQYDGLPRDHLLSIIENLKSNPQNVLSPCTRKSESPHSDLERNELLCETPHQEIVQLQNYFMDMLAEVDHLKVTISDLQVEQQKTVSLLKQKDSNITQLAKEIKHLKRPKSEIKPPSSAPIIRKNKKKTSLGGINKEKEKLQNNSHRGNAIENNDREVKSCPLAEMEDLDLKEQLHCQVIQTRTMSTQKIADEITCACKQTRSKTEFCPYSRIMQGNKTNNDENKRREKFNNLMEEMLEGKTSYSYSTACK